MAVKAEIIADSGAFAGYSAPVLTRTVLHGAGPYRVPNLWIEAKAIYTNNPTTGAMRGFGVPQAALAHERQMDLLAAATGLDPFEIRLDVYKRQVYTMLALAVLMISMIVIMNVITDWDLMVIIPFVALTFPIISAVFQKPVSYTHLPTGYEPAALPLSYRPENVTFKV